MLFRRSEPLLRHYVSEMDSFLAAFDLKPEASSESRRQEEEKHATVANARDHVMALEPRKQIWEDF